MTLVCGGTKNSYNNNHKKGSSFDESFFVYFSLTSIKNLTILPINRLLSRNIESEKKSLLLIYFKKNN